MTMIKRSVAVVVRGPEAGTFLVVKRPDDPADPLAGVWGFPAVTLADGEDERAAVVRAGRDKLGVVLEPGNRLGQASADRGAYRLVLADYEAAIVDGTPAVPQPDASVTQYVEWRFTADPAELAEAAGRGSLCAQIFLEISLEGDAQDLPPARNPPPAENSPPADNARTFRAQITARSAKRETPRPRGWRSSGGGSGSTTWSTCTPTSCPSGCSPPCGPTSTRRAR